jgi:FO synthase
MTAADTAALPGRSAADLVAAVGRMPDRHGDTISYSRKVFLPLTQLCRDVCHYCTFAHPPRRGERAYLPLDRVLDIARAGERAGCQEALFTLGDKPELRYTAARDELAMLGHETTLSYLAEACRQVLSHTSLLPHVNAGVMTPEDLAMLREVSVSQGLMLESSSERLMRRGGPHHGSPDKHPAVRLAMIREAGRLRIPFTTGLLIGIGETRGERVEALVALKRIHDEFGHLQEIIIQNFRAKPGTRMAAAAEPDAEELQWTIAAARLIFGAAMPIQSPPNLTPRDHRLLIDAGIDDWGGISPVTIDHVNPEAPWPAIDTLRQVSTAAGRTLVERLALYPRFARDPEKWVAAPLRAALLRASDADGFGRPDGWCAGRTEPPPPPRQPSGPPVAGNAVGQVLDRLARGAVAREDDIVALFAARGADVERVCAAADAQRRASVGDDVTYAVNCNLNYTNICRYACSFCAFSKASRRRGLRDDPYDLDLATIQERAVIARSRGATELCMQGGIHPRYDGNTYLAILAAVKEAVPELHVHAFSPLEVYHGATTLGIDVDRFLEKLAAAGLGSLPGTAAEILDDEVRAQICPDKLDTEQWLAVVEAAHRVGLRTTATIMFGHVDTSRHWARHLLRIRALQARTGGFTEFVPLPFVHDESPIFRAGRARRGPTWREAVLMHAVARLVLDPLIANIQVSWVKMGPDGARACLAAGANDLGGTLMRESISRAAGAAHGQELAPDEMRALIRSLGRTPRQRTTLYGDPTRPVAALAAAS